MLRQTSITGFSLEAAGLVALADLSSIASRTALTGTASYVDVLFLAPGIHCQRNASEVNGGELPAAGAMTSGYVFRIENQATVSYLQSIGKPGCLVTVRVRKSPKVRDNRRLLAYLGQSFVSQGLAVSALYMLGPVLTITVIVLLGLIRDWWGLSVLFMLALARLLNVIVIRRRANLGWKGAPEPDQVGDLLILVSQDRWIRMRGLVDDIKVVTAGQWLRDEGVGESGVVSAATLLVYVSAALAGNASVTGSLLMALLLLISAGLLGICNALSRNLNMFGRVVSVSEGPKQYERRLLMARELIEETGRDDWAIGLGLISAGEKTQKVVL